ncbi:MAG: SGNH/GDSL hydrolase family protein [Chloroflexota bacterium]|nr:SGNH/GDSL hydrolase family protein [Chloroflexota bacterium]
MQATQPATQPAPARKGRGRALAEGLLVLAITLGLMLGLLEIGLRLFAPQIVPPLGGLFIADPATAYRLKPDVRVPFRFAEGSPVFSTNSQGLREDHLVGPPLPGRTRLLNIGDSFTFGMGVNAEQAFPQRLDGLTVGGDRVESINAGVFGYGTDNEAAWLHTYGWPLQPRLVLVGFFVGNDVKDTMLGMDKTTVDAAGRLIATDKSKQALQGADGADPDTATSGGGIKAWLENNSHAYLFLRNFWTALRPVKPRAPTVFDAASFFLTPEPPAITTGWTTTLGVLDGIRADVQAHHARLIVVAIPTREQVQDPSWREMQAQFGLTAAQVQRDLPQQQLAAWATHTGTPLVDLLPAFRAAGQSQTLYFRTDRHWTAAGHALAADQIKAYLTQQNLLK